MIYNIGGIPMAWPAILGAGFAKNPRHLIPLIGKDIPLGAYVVGSFTLKDQSGNEGAVKQWPIDWSTFLAEGGGLNAWGMPNDGTEAGVDTLESVPLDRPAIVSHAAFNPEGYPASMVIADRSASVAGHEANASCGNTGKQPFAYDPDATNETLRAIGREVMAGHITKPVWWKIAPFITMKERAELATWYPRFNFELVPTVPEEYLETYLRLVMCYPFIRAIVIGNTLSGCRAFDAHGKTVTSPFEGRAGLSGPILKEISMRLVRRAVAVRKSFETVSIIAGGGVITGDDSIDVLNNGADAYQCTSGPVWYRDPARFFADHLTSDRFVERFANEQP